MIRVRFGGMFLYGYLDEPQRIVLAIIRASVLCWQQAYTVKSKPAISPTCFLSEYSFHFSRRFLVLFALSTFSVVVSSLSLCLTLTLTLTLSLSLSPDALSFVLAAISFLFRVCVRVCVCMKKLHRRLTQRQPSSSQLV